MESLVLSGAPDAPVLAKPGALALSQSVGVPSIEVVLSKPSNTGAPHLLLSLHFDVVDSFLLIAYALLVSGMVCVALEY